MNRDGVEMEGKRVAEVNFLNSVIKSKKGTVCVLMSAKGRSRGLEYQQRFTTCRFYYFGRSISDEEYDPCNPHIQYRYGVRVDKSFVTGLYQRFRTVVLMCDGETSEYQRELVEDIVRPCEALLQIEPPYPNGSYVGGKLLFPTHPASLLTGLVYLYYKHGDKPKQYDPMLLHGEMLCFQMLTRGYLSSDQRAYDERVELLSVGLSSGGAFQLVP